MGQDAAAMLDLKSIIMMLGVTVTLQGVVWIYVWAMQRRFYELRLIAAGSIVGAVGMYMIILRGPAPPAWHIVLDNAAINAGLVLIVSGLARFLNQPAYPVIGISCIVFTLLFWPLALYLDPANVAPRIYATSGVTIIIMLMAIRTMLNDRTQPKSLRIATIIILLTHAVASAARSMQIALDSAGTELPNANGQAWYFFESNLFMMTLFLAMMMMVGVRMASDLRQRNAELEREVGERRRLQEQLSQSLRTEKALREEQRQLLRMVSHEFRTPLAIIDRAAEMIEVVLDKPPGTVEMRLSSIRGAVRRLLMLIDRFLDSERHPAELVQPSQMTIDDLFARVTHHFDDPHTIKRLSFSTDSALPAYGGDAEMLATVMAIIIDNALKYSDEDSPVEIAAGLDGDAILITVTDCGIGIPADEMPSIGRRFFRASNTKPATGTGIGLHSARQLLGYHHGDLSLRTRPEGGTIVTIRLPLPGLVPVTESKKDSKAA
jgi:two-component system OmpR family sensor kinase